MQPKLLQPLLLIPLCTDTQLPSPSQTTLARPFAFTFDILLVAPHNQNNMKTWQTSSSLGFLLSCCVLHVKRSPIQGVCNPPIDVIAGFSSAICIMDIDWPTSLTALQILQSPILPFDAALLLGLPTTASLAATSQTLLLFVCLPAIRPEFRPANRLAIRLAIRPEFRPAIRLGIGRELGTN
jgi:hypothetical protein